MAFLYEIIPVFLFFIVFKFYDIYAATVVGIVATCIQVFLTRIFKGQWDRKELVVFLTFVIFGGMTLYFHDPIFVKWKPTIVFWVFALIIVGTQFFTAKPMMQRLMENMVEHNHLIPRRSWLLVNISWCLFFIVMGAINLFVAYSFSNNAWVNFKFYGITSALVLFSILQALYLMRYLPEKK